MIANITAADQHDWIWQITLDEDVARHQARAVAEFVAALRPVSKVVRVRQHDYRTVLVDGWVPSTALRAWATDWWAAHEGQWPPQEAVLPEPDSETATGPLARRRWWGRRRAA